MNPEEPKGPQAPGAPGAPEGAPPASNETVSYSQATDLALSSPDPYTYDDSPPTELAPPASPPPSPPKPPETKEPEEEDEGMLRMSFLEHLEELRARIIKALIGVAVAFGISLFFQDEMWQAVVEPVRAALRSLGVPDKIIQIEPTETFFVLWVKLPIIAAAFLASPWVLYQVWAFIAPGLYKRERRYAVPFVIASAGLFILGGLFAYFVAFRFGLTFLLGIGVGKGVVPQITVSHYFDLFMNVMLGVGLVFELPVLIFLLTLVRVVTPKFLLDHSRYAILIIVILAAIVTPTPDVFNLMLFSVPMCILYYIGIFAGYLLTLSREGKKFPWGKVLFWLFVVAVAIGGLVYLAVTKYGYHLAPQWPFLIR